MKIPLSAVRTRVAACIAQGSAQVFVLILSALLLPGCQHYKSVPLNARTTARQFAGRSLDEPGLRDYIERALGHALPEWPVRIWDFEKLSLASFYFQPALDVNRAQWEVAKAGQKTARGRRNPVLTVTPGFSANAPAGVSPWLPLGSVDVPIETAGKRKARLEQSAWLAEAARLGIESAAWQARSNLRAAILDFNLSRRQAELIEQQLSLQDETVQLLEQRLAAGAASPYEVTSARASRLRLQSDLADARLRNAASRAAIAQAAGIPASAFAEVELARTPPGIHGTAEELLSSEARAAALQGRADILAALAEYAAAESALRLEIARQYPDVHLNPGYQFDQGEHKWSIGLTLELPLLNRNEGPIAEAEARRREAAARFEALQAQVIAAMDLAANELTIRTAQLKRSQEFLRLQQQQADATGAAFRAGAADRLELVTAQFETRAAELAAADLEVRAQAALGKLEEALQRPIPGLEQIDSSARARALAEGSAH